jgi:beta-glucosidase
MISNRTAASAGAVAVWSVILVLGSKRRPVAIMEHPDYCTGGEQALDQAARISDNRAGQNESKGYSSVASLGILHSVKRQPSYACSMMQLPALTTVMAIAFLLRGTMSSAAGQPQPPLRCGLFATSVEAAPQTDPEAVQRFEIINREAQAGSHTVVFLGDSLTQKWDRSVWDQNFARLRPLNARVNGDRTENLLWRIEHGNLDGQRPNLLVLLIGTNDIGRNRPAAVIAEGIRQILIDLRSRLPEARILLLGVLPRSELPSSHRRRQVAEVNQLIQTCADNRKIVYVNVGDALLDPAGRLSREVSPDGVHLSEHGYARLTNRLQQEFGRLLSAR